MVRQVEGQRRLADADRPGEDQRMRQLSRSIGGGKHLGRLPVPDQTGRFGRFGHAVQRIVLFRRDAFEDHTGAACLLRAGALASRATNTAAVTTCSTVSGSADASMTMQRSGSAAAIARKASRRA